MQAGASEGWSLGREDASGDGVQLNVGNAKAPSFSADPAGITCLVKSDTPLVSGCGTPSVFLLPLSNPWLGDGVGECAHHSRFLLPFISTEQGARGLLAERLGGC